MRYLLFILLFISYNLTAQTGFTSPSATGEDYNEISHTPAEAYSSNNVSAYEMYNESFPARQDYYNFGFSIADGNTINGIEVKIEGNSDNGTVLYIQTELSWNGGVTYTTTGKYATYNTTADAIVTLGNATDLWGRSWQETDFTNANFRVRVTLQPAAGAPYTAGIDQIQVNVYYSTTTGSAATLEAYWPLNNSGDDLAGNHNLIGAGGTVNYSSDYKLAGTHSAFFNPSYGYLKTNNKIDMTTGAWTVNFGLRPGGNGVLFVALGNRIGNTKGWIIGYNGSQVIVSMHDGTTEGTASSVSNALTMYQWNWVSVVWPDINNGDSCLIYINGVRSGTDITTISGAGLNDTVSVGSFRSGGYETWGWVDNVSIYNDKLTTSQILDLYNHRTETYSLETLSNEFLPLEVKPHDKKRQSGLRLKFYDRKYEASALLTLFDTHSRYIAEPPSSYTPIGIYATMGSEDYDGVYGAGADLYTDADYATTYFSRASLRKLKSAADFANKVYIDPTASPGGDGSIGSPYDAWSDVTFADNTAYLQKCGTRAITSAYAIYVNVNNYLIGSYGTGDKPIIEAETNIANVFWLTGNGIVRDIYFTLPDAYAKTDQNNYSAITIAGYYTVDIYNCDIYKCGFGINCAAGTTSPWWVKDIRIIKCTIDKIHTDAIFLNAEYAEVAFTSITNINDFATIEPRKDIPPGTNNGSTGDGIEAHWYNQLYIHNNTIDHGSQPNKATLMLHAMMTEKILIENNILVSPEQGLTVTHLLNSAKPFTFRNNLCLNSPLSVHNNTGLWITGGALADSVYGNVFAGFREALYTFSQNGVYVNNTFYDNTFAITTTTAAVVNRIQNNIFENNINIATKVTATNNSNNTFSDANFVYPALTRDVANFSISSGSQAIGAGLNFSFRKYDLVGTLIGSSTDAGAFEYTTGITTQGGPPSNPYAGRNDVLYVNPISGSDDSTGTSPAKAVKTLAKAQTMLSSFDVVALADTVHEGVLFLNNWDGTSGDPNILGTYWIYGNDKATVSAYKTVGPFTNIGGYLWQATDAALPSGAERRPKGVGGLFSWLLPKYGYLLKGSEAYVCGRYPETGFLNSTGASSAGPPTYIDDAATIFTNGFWDGAYINYCKNPWTLEHSRVTYSGSRYTFTANSPTDASAISAGDLANRQFVITNHKNTLNANWEWAYNATSKVLTLYSTTNPNNEVLKFTARDSVITTLNSDYIRIENIKVIGGIETGIKISGGSNVLIDTCEVGWVDGVGIHGYGVTGLTIQNSYIHDAGSHGSYTPVCSGLIIQKNRYINIANKYEIAKASPFAICDKRISGTGTITLNYIYNCGLGGIQKMGSRWATPGDQVISKNFVRKLNQIITDAAGYYGSIHKDESAFTGQYTSYVLDNYFGDIGSTESALFVNGITTDVGIYIDGHGKDHVIEGNVIERMSFGLFTNGPGPNWFRRNLVNDPAEHNPGLGSAIYISPTEDASNGNLFSKNILIGRDSVDHLFSIRSDNGSTWGLVYADSNTYENPIDENAAKTHMSIAIWTPTNRAMSFFQAAPFGYDTHSTFNAQGWTFADVTGINRNQFTLIFYNWSATNHVYNLGTAILKDPITGATVSGTLTVAPYKYRVLYYSSGSRLSVENPIYIP